MLNYLKFCALLLTTVTDADNAMKTLKATTFFILTIILFSCGHSSHDKKNEKDLSVIDTIDFCKDCDSLDFWQGGIQDDNVSDSTKVYPFAECHTNKSYDIIWVPKGDILKFKSSIGLDSLFKFYDNSKKTNYKDLDCYSFVIPKTKHIPKEVNPDCDDCEDLDTYDYVFPSQVDIFKKVDNGWTHLSTKKVKTFEELGRLKLNTIFHVD